MRSLKSHLKKKGQIGSLPMAIMSLVVAIIVLVVGLVILQEIRDTDMVTPGTAGCNATDKAQCETLYTSANTSLVGLGDFADFIPIIVIAIAASVIIGLILIGFAFSSRQR